MSHCCLSRPWITRLTLCFSLLLIGMPVLADEIDDEFRFASALIEWGFPDYADKVVQQILRQFPSQQDRAKLIQAEVLISRRKFTEAEDLVKAMGAGNPKAQAITLALAKGYYAMGETEKAKQLYNDFFKLYEGKVPTDPDLLRFYQDSAYQFGQMLETAGDKEGAIKAYARVLSSNPDRNTTRLLQAQQAELYVQVAQSGPVDQREKNLTAAKKLCDEIQWGGLDIPFGQSIITAAHIEIVRGNTAAAQKVLQNNLDILKEIDTYLKDSGLPMSVSPMAGARFLLGDLLEKDANALSKNKEKVNEAIQTYARALTEFYNVFAKYGDSDWGSQAGMRAQQIKTILEEQYGKKINVDLGQFQTKAAETQFRLADNLFRQKQYQSAVSEYLKNLNQFPETDASVAALGNLAIAYASENDPFMVKVVSLYMGERFAGRPRAALGLLALGKHYFDLKDEPMYMFAYETYLQYFPQDERAAAILFTLATMRTEAGDPAGAAKYFQQIVSNYPKDKYYTKAINQLSWGYYASSNYEGAAKSFALYVAEAQPSPDKAKAQFMLADSYRQLGKFPEALAEYEKLVQWLAPKNNPFATSAADVRKNSELLEKAVYQRAYCYSRIGGSPDVVKDNREKSIRGYDMFIQLFPQSDMASSAMNAKGTVQLELGQFDAATKTFDELAAKYPQSEEGKSALFALVRSALEIKQYDQAKSAFAKMLTGGGQYTADQFVRIGQMMLDGGQYPEAIKAFEKIETMTEERTLLERSLYGLGRALYETKQYTEAIKALESMLERYPKSGLFYGSKFMLGEAYRETQRLDDAVKALSDVFRSSSDPMLINRASMALGAIQILQGDKMGALASYQRVALLTDTSKPEFRPLVEESLVKAIDLAMELGRYQDVQDSCDQYLKDFPAGDKIEVVRKAKADAKLKAAQAPAPVQPAAGPAGP